MSQTSHLLIIIISSSSWISWKKRYSYLHSLIFDSVQDVETSQFQKLSSLTSWLDGLCCPPCLDWEEERRRCWSWGTGVGRKVGRRAFAGDHQASEYWRKNGNKTAVWRRSLKIKILNPCCSQWPLLSYLSSWDHRYNKEEDKEQ